MTGPSTSKNTVSDLPSLLIQPLTVDLSSLLFPPRCSFPRSLPDVSPSVECAQCGYPAAKMRSYNWGLKAKRRKTTWVFLPRLWANTTLTLCLSLPRSHPSALLDSRHRFCFVPLRLSCVVVPVVWLTSSRSSAASRMGSGRAPWRPRRPRRRRRKETYGSHAYVWITCLCMGVSTSGLSM